MHYVYNVYIYVYLYVYNVYNVYNVYIQEKRIFDELEESLLPLLSRCLALEMCEVYSEIWQTIVFKKPPWQSLTPVLESINK